MKKIVDKQYNNNIVTQNRKKDFKNPLSRVWLVYRLLGGNWNNGANCGSRASNWNNGPLNLNSNNGARGVSIWGTY